MSSHSLHAIKPTDATWIFDACQDEQIQYWTTVPKPYLMEHAIAFANGKTNEKGFGLSMIQMKKRSGLLLFMVLMKMEMLRLVTG